MATGQETNISIVMMERMWALLSALAKELSDKAEESIDDFVQEAQGLDVGVDTGRVNDALNALDRIHMPSKPATSSVPTSASPPAGFDLPTAPTVPSVHYAGMERYDPMADVGLPPSLDDFGNLDMDTLRNLYDSDRMEMMEALKRSFKEFMAEYFPPGEYFAKAKAWLERAVDAQGTGIPIHIEGQIWERDRSRINNESTRATKDALKTWGARGYMLPPGALVGQVAAVRREQINQLSQQSRDIAIKVTDVHIDNAKFAVQQSLQLRKDAIDAAVNYIKALMVSPEMAGQWINSLIDGQARIAQAQASIYSARVGAATDVFKTDAGVKLDKFKTGADVAIETGKLQSSTELGVFTATTDARRQRFLAQLQAWSTNENNRLETYKIAEDKLIRFYEAEIRARGIESDMIMKAGELGLRTAEVDARNALEQAKIKLDAVTEKAKMIATQAAAALNNFHMSAGTSNSSSTSQSIK